VIDTCWKPHPGYSERDILCGPLDVILDPEGWLAYAEHELNRLSFVIERRGTDQELERQKELYRSAVNDMKKSRFI
jgi:lysyl-tRNA synthetase class I